MRKLFGLCVLVVLTSSFYGFGQSTNKAAKEAFEKGIKAQSSYDFNSAIINYTKAIKLDSKYAVAYNNRGNAYNALKKYEEAITDYTKAIELDPKNAVAYYNRGNAYYALKKHEEALVDLTKAIKLDPNYVKAYYNRGGAYNALKK